MIEISARVGYMAKTNFSKAEETLANILEQMKISNLLIRADEASGKTPPSKERLQLVHTLQHQLNFLYRNDRDLYKKLKIKRKDLARALENISAMTDQEWQHLVVFKEKIDAYLKELPAVSQSNEQIVEKERHKHINKRFNVSDKWLPLK